MFIKPCKDGFVYTHNDKPVVAEYENYTCPEDYKKAGIKYVIPMTAEELVTEEEQDKAFNDPNMICEIKIDGVRATLHLFKTGNRVFSRRESVKTKWFSENSDSLPQLKCIDCGVYDRTILDGELLIPDQSFNVTSGTMNCTWDKAVYRQYYELGFAVFNAFDITYYKGECVEDKPLSERKTLLQEVVHQLNSEWIQSVTSIQHFISVRISREDIERMIADKHRYPTLYSECFDLSKKEPNTPLSLAMLSKKAYYEYVIMNGGEGVMMKPLNGQYVHKRGKEYLKIKAFTTREVIILGFDEPTKEYEGKYPTLDKWNYWENHEGDIFDTSVPAQYQRVLEDSKADGVVPVSKYYAEGWVGSILMGLVITPEEKAQLLKSKKAKEFKFHLMGELELVEVGKCSGFDEETRKYFTAILEEMYGTVIEIKTNFVYKDTGKMRHPRYLRQRLDCNREKCTWKDHIL